MGIKGLNKLINQYAASAISQKHISEFCGSRIAIDSEILIHKYRSMDSKNSHIFGFINNIYWYLKNGIIPIYVFDGCPSVAKQTNALTKRSTYREQISRKIEELENKFVEQLDNIDKYPSEDSLELNPEINDTLDQLMKIQRKMTFMTVGKNYRNECKYLLKLMGIPFIVANEDAEAFCVTLQKNGMADYVYTEDTDIIPYFIASMEDEICKENTKPIKILRKGLLSSMVTVIDINEILIKMKLSPKSFVDMCILSGCDFCTTIAKIGPMKSYTYMQKFHSIENLKNAGICLPDDFKYQDARDIFFRSHHLQIEKNLDLGTISTEDLKIYLQHERGVNPFPIIEKYHRIYIIFQSRCLFDICADHAAYADHAAHADHADLSFFE